MEDGSRKTEVRSRKLEVGSWESGVGRLKSEVGRWKLEDRSQEKGDRRKTSDFKLKKAMKFKFENLIIWQKAMELGDEINMDIFIKKIHF